ncbi:MAG: hypothetical protein WCP97_03455 [bacterium]
MAETILFETDQAFATIPGVQRALAAHSVVFGNEKLYLLNHGESFWASAFRITKYQHGLIGILLAKLFIGKKSKEFVERRKQVPLEQLLDENTKSKALPYSSIESFEVKTGILQMRVERTLPIFLWIEGKKWMVCLPKDAQQKAAELLRSKCAGREKTK